MNKKTGNLLVFILVVFVVSALGGVGFGHPTKALPKHVAYKATFKMKPSYLAAGHGFSVIMDFPRESCGAYEVKVAPDGQGGGSGEAPGALDLSLGFFHPKEVSDSEVPVVVFHCMSVAARTSQDWRELCGSGEGEDGEEIDMGGWGPEGSQGQVVGAVKVSQITCDPAKFLGHEGIKMKTTAPYPFNDGDLAPYTVKVEPMRNPRMDYGDPELQ